MGVFNGLELLMDGIDYRHRFEMYGVHSRTGEINKIVSTDSHAVMLAEWRRQDSHAQFFTGRSGSTAAFLLTHSRHLFAAMHKNQRFLQPGCCNRQADGSHTPGIMKQP